MADLVAFLRWLIEYSVGGGFIHFCAVVIVVRVLSGFTTLVRVTRPSPKAKAKRDQDKAPRREEAE